MSSLNQFILDFTPKVATPRADSEKRRTVTLDAIFSDRTHADRVRPPQMLQLSVTSERALTRGGILSTGGAFDAWKAGKLEAKEFGSKLKDELTEQFEILRDYIDEKAGRVRWVKFAHDPRVGVRNLCFTGPEISRLHPEDAAKDISCLHFNKAQKTLKREGWDTIGKLFAALELGIRDVKTFGKSAQREVAERAHALSFAIDSQGNVDWLAFAEQLNLEVLPSKSRWRGGNDKLVQLFPELVRQTIQLSGKDMELDAFEARLLLPRDSRPTLAEIGDRFEVTRERIRQLEVLTVDRVQRALFEENYDQSTFRFRPELQALFRRAKRHFGEFGEAIWKAEGWISELAELWECDESFLADHTTLFTEVLGFDEYLPRNGNAGLIIFPNSLSKEERQLRLKQIAAVEKCLHDWPLPTAPEDLLAAANQRLGAKKEIDEAELENLLTLSGDIISDEEGNLQIQFSELKLSEQALRVVVENGEPLRHSEIEKLIEEKGGKSVSRIGGHLARQEHLVPIGRSGNWAWNQWDLETGTIVEVTEEILRQAGEALSEKMLREMVQKKRPLSFAAIPTLLEQKPEIFVELGPHLWGLVEWGDEASPALGHWTYEALTAFIEDIFNEERSTTLSFSLLREKLQESSNYSNQKASGMLRSHPRLAFTGPPRDRKARFLSLSEAEEKAREETKKERKPIRRGKNWKAIHSWLNRRFDDLDGEASPLNDIVKGVESELSIARHITYGVISQSEEFETFSLDNSPIKLCRRPHDAEEVALEELAPGTEADKAKEEPKTEPKPEAQESPAKPVAVSATFPGANRIQKEIEKLRYDKWKNELVRGKGFMSPDTVDIALICAGRVFDDALKVLVEIAKKKGAVPVDSYRDDRDLKSRIDWAVRCRLFEDSDQLHLLRKERNQHAHNIAGPERARIWESAPLLFSEYVTCIYRIENHLAKFLGAQPA
ncbi:MAG: sigma factor-like helix-turn-helix DNA-binding protein [Verrucomicrobiota bacterium]